MDSTMVATEYAPTQCVCGERAAYVIVSLPDHGYRPIGRCMTCSVIRTLQRPANVLELYTTDLRYHANQQQQEGKAPYPERFAHDESLGASRVRLIHRRQRVLDVGCANGGFLSAAAHNGYQVFGIEPNAGMREFVKERVGCEVWSHWAAVPGGLHFDIITYHDVFEHVVDPVNELDVVAGRLRGSGFLVLDVPDVDTAFGGHWLIDWKHWRPEQHLWHWGADTLCQLLRDRGYVVDWVDRPIAGKMVVYARYMP